MSNATRNLHRRAKWSAALIACVTAAATLTGSAEVGASPPGTVLRGSLTGGIWVELAHDGQNYAELAILDGLPGGPPQTQFVPLTTNFKAGNCGLASADGLTSISPCPFNGAYSATISIGAMTGTATLRDVGWTGSYAWGQPNAPTADIRTQCSLPSLSQAGYLSTTPLSSPVSVVSRSAQSLPAKQAGSAAELSRLRADRLRAYSALSLSAEEAQRAKQVEDSVAGRAVLGRTASLADATRDKIAFDKDVLNQPARIQAREELLQIDQALSAIYDVDGTGGRVSLVTKLKDTDLPGALRALDDTLALRLPGSVADLIQLESAAADLDNCGAALGLPLKPAARARVRTAMVQRAPDLVSAIRISVNASAGSTAARTMLQSWESNAAVRSALEAAGETGIFEEARGKVLQLAAAEEKARIEAEKQAALEAERDKIPPTTKKGEFEFSRIEQANIFILNVDDSSRGSGFIVAPGYVVSNQHVVEGAKTVLLVRNKDTVADHYVGTVVKTSTQKDLALISAPGLKGKTVGLAGADPRDGETVWAVGYPSMADREELTASYVAKSFITNGIVNRIYEANMGTARTSISSRVIQHEAAIAGGNSGGALFDDCHRVVGVNTQGWSDPKGRSKLEISVAVSSLELIEFLKGTGVTPNVTSHECR